MDFKQAKRVVIFVIGVTLLLVGFAFFFLPGPGIVLVILALVILASEFVWAKRLLKKVKSKF